MAKLRHIAVIVPDPEAAATFFEQAFDMKRCGVAARHSRVRRRRQRRPAQEGKGRRADRHRPLRHVGGRSRRRREEGAGGRRRIPVRPADSPKSFYEAKYRDPRRHRVRSHPHRLGGLREGRGAEALGMIRKSGDRFSEKIMPNEKTYSLPRRQFGPGGRPHMSRCLFGSQTFGFCGRSLCQGFGSK